MLFWNLGSVTKVKLLKAYCSSYYGCELWDMWDGETEVFCKAGDRVSDQCGNCHLTLIDVFYL
jgi:hypothetical protein